MHKRVAPKFSTVFRLDVGATGRFNGAGSLPHPAPLIILMYYTIAVDGGLAGALIRYRQMRLENRLFGPKTDKVSVLVQGFL